MLGFALVALSIWFNTSRYPSVWEMTNPLRPDGSAPPAVTASVENTESSASTPPPTVADRSAVASGPDRPAVGAPPDTEGDHLDEKTSCGTATPAAKLAGPPAAEKPSEPAAAGSETASNSPANQAGAADLVDSAADHEPAAAPEARKPLVPITPVRLPPVSDQAAALAAGVRRLPPVDTVNSGRTAQNVLATFRGTLPAYPKTRTP